MQTLFKTIHTWTGILFGIFICLVTVTGSVLVFKQSIEDGLGPKVAAASPGSARVNVNDAATQVLAAYPGARITRVRLPNQSRNSYMFTVEDADKRTRKVVTDAASGRVAGELNTAWMDWTVDLHRNVLLGKTGRQLAGCIGIILFAMSATGVILSLLRKPRWRSLITVRPGAPWRRFHYELHRSLGVWSYGFLALLSFTGIGLAFPDAFRSVLGRAEKPVAVEALKQRAPAALALLPFDQYILISHLAVPEAEITEVRLPKSAKDAVSVRFHLRSDLGEGSRNEISIEPERGEVLAVQRTSDQPFGVRVQKAFTPVHYGEAGGSLIKLLWSLAGLTPCILFVTGLVVWLKKKPRRRAKADAIIVEQPEEVAYEQAQMRRSSSAAM